MSKNPNILCAIYARYSSTNQREASIEDQIRRCRQFAASRNWVVLEDYIYVDQAISGNSLDARNAFKRLLRAALFPNPPFQYILVDDTSRVARNTREALEVFHVLSFNDIGVHFVSQGIDTKTEIAEEIITMHGLMDALFLKELAAKTKRGMEGQVLKQFSAGGRRYGYRSVPVYNGKVDIYGLPIAEGYKLVIEPTEAQTVLRIFKMYGEEGLSARRIVNILNKELKEKGYPKPPRGKFWSVTTILGSPSQGTGILNNELYRGRYRWNRISTKRNPVTGKVKRIKNSKEDWIEVLVPDLRIVPDELWFKVKARQKEIATSAKKAFAKAKSRYSSNLFTGLIQCGLCGGNIVVVQGGKRKRYGCATHWNKGGIACANNLKIRKEVLWEEISKNLSFKLDAQDKTYILDRGNNLIDEEYAKRNQNSQIEWLKKELSKTQKELQNIAEAIKAGIITETTKELLVQAENKKKMLTKELNKALEQKPQKLCLAVEVLENYLSKFPSFLEKYPVIGREIVKKYLGQIILIPLNNGQYSLKFSKKISFKEAA